MIHTLRSARYTVLMDYDGSGNLIYLGRAAPGSLTSAPVWQLEALSIDGSNNTTSLKSPSNSEAFAFIWDNRASYVYG